MTRRLNSVGPRRPSAATPSQPSVIVVGAGIVGLAHAWAAAKRGCKVTVLERDPRPRGASIRNFGMVWPIGQPKGPDHRMALLSRQLWLEFLSDAKIWHRCCGSLHLAYRKDELAVIQEFSRLADSIGYECELLSPQAAVDRSPGVRGSEILGALWSPTEVSVNPRQVIHEMPKWLEALYGVEFHYNVPVIRADSWAVSAADGARWKANHVVIAAGADFRLMFPELYRSAGFQLCKLQMLRTLPQPKGWQLGPMIASGLTLRHYDSFSICRSLPNLKDRIAAEMPELDDFGIHVMAAQNERGELILGDSHEYGDHVSPYDKRLIDDLILRELQQILAVPEWKISERWHGVYAKAPNRIEYVDEIDQNVYVAIASGGCGMTMSFGLADSHWNQWLPTGAQTNTNDVHTLLTPNGPAGTQRDESVK